MRKTGGFTSMFAFRAFVYLFVPIAALWLLELNWDQIRDIRSASIRRIQISKSINHGLESLVLEDSQNIVIRVATIVQKYPECRGKERLVEILIKAGKGDALQAECEMLPTWEEVSGLYGDEPIVHGLETCSRYRESLSAEANGGQAVEPDPRIAGLFNTGTNAFADSLSLNFRKVSEHKEYDLHGGKHTRMSARRWVKKNDTSIRFFPIVLIRDPFRWMSSMCKSPYVTHWQKGEFDRCPNLVPSFHELQTGGVYRRTRTFSVQVEREYEERYASLADMWSEWYREFYDADFPRLIIRYEDTLFHADRVMELIAKCVGRPLKEPFRYHMEASKVHGKPSDFATALAKYGTKRGRYTGLLPEDRKYAQTALDSNLMRVFHYPQVPLDLGAEYRLEDEQLAGLEIQYESCKGKKQVLGMLLRAGLKGLSRDLCDRLPSWNNILSSYGKEPQIIGLETCESFRHSLNGTEVDLHIGGLYHSGAEFMSDLLTSNLQLLAGKQLSPLPGRGHAPTAETRRLHQLNVTHAAPSFFPIYMVQDPFYFMINMCKSPNAAHWEVGWYGRCPNLVPSEFERQMNDTGFKSIKSFTVTIDGAETEESYNSLLDLWVSWYNEILHSPMPRLLIRYEDALFHPEAVVRQVSECLGMSSSNVFAYQLGRGNLPGSNLVGSMEQYNQGRYTGLTLEDREYIQQTVDHDLLEALHYAAVQSYDYVEATNEQFAGFEYTFQSCIDKKRLLGILHRAGKGNITEEDCQKLPSWKTVTSLYGREPIILGLDRCHEYQATLASKGDRRHQEPNPLVGGLYNTGTSAFSEALSLNFRAVNNSRKDYALPGGKHTLLTSRSWYQHLSNTTDISFLPIIIIRDPLRWMRSMCNVRYKAAWAEGYRGRCPNLVPSAFERTMLKFRNTTTFEVIVNQKQQERYASLVDMWYEWYHLFLTAEFPRLIIRFEDTLFHAEKVMDMVLKCIDSPLQRPYQYLLEKSKPVTSDLPAVLGKYGSEIGRYDHLTREDAEYFGSIVLPSFTEMFHYPRIPLKALQADHVSASGAMAVVGQE